MNEKKLFSIMESLADSGCTGAVLSVPDVVFKELGDIHFEEGVTANLETGVPSGEIHVIHAGVHVVFRSEKKIEASPVDNDSADGLKFLGNDGEWTVSDKEFCGRFQVDFGTEGLGVDVWWDSTTRSDKLKSMANAKLIAASKDLLDACQEFVGKVDRGEARSTKSYAQMKKAIEKALK